MDLTEEHTITRFESAMFGFCSGPVLYTPYADDGEIAKNKRTMC